MVAAGLMTAQSWDHSSVLRWSRWRERMESKCFNLLDLMLTVQKGKNYFVLVYWTCGWEQKCLLFMQRLAIPTEWKKKTTTLLQTKPKRVPSPWSSVYSQICHTLIQRVSFHLTFIVERVWFLYLAQLLISDYIKCCIIWWFTGFTCNCAIKGHEKKCKQY